MTGGTPPGWYPDPSGAPGMRWWDGQNWAAGRQSSAWHSPPHSWRSSGEIISGIITTGIGVIGWVFVSNANSQCQSGLGQLAQAFSTQTANDCQVVGIVHLLAVVAIVVGIILVLVGVVNLAKSPATPMHHPPGWYDDPNSSGSQRWWDGHRWTDYRRPSI